MKNYMFRRHLLFVNIFMITGIIVLFSTAVCIYFIQISNRNFADKLNVVSSGVTSQIDSSMQMSDEVALQLVSNMYIINMFDEMNKSTDSRNYFLQNPNADANMKKFMWSYILEKNSISRICVFDKSQNFSYVGSAVNYDFMNRKGLTDDFVDNVKNYFQDTAKSSYYKVYDMDPFSDDPGKIISVTREIKDMIVLPSVTRGYVEVQIPLKSFDKYFESIDSSVQVYIVDSSNKNTIYSSNETSGVSSFIHNLTTKQLEQNGLISIPDGYKLKSSSLNQYGLYLVLVENNDIQIKFIITTIIWGILISALTIALSTFGQMKIINKTTEPIVDLCNQLQNMDTSKEKFEIPIIVPQESNELRQLNFAFNGILANLKASMDKAMVSRLSELQSHMYALQAQMNPHFIHNILSVISTLSNEGDYRKIPRICEKLSEIIRYSANYNDSYISLKEEINNTINYLELMEIRYEDKFNYTLNYMGVDLEFPIPKFIFQPLVENCFKYGLKNKEFPWQIDIMIYAEKNMWTIEISDNGLGAGEEKLRAIRRQVETIKRRPVQDLMADMKIGGLSLANICARLFLAYEDNMIFEVGSLPTNGFQIKIGGSKVDSSNGS